MLFQIQQAAAWLGRNQMLQSVVVYPWNAQASSQPTINQLPT